MCASFRLVDPRDGAAIEFGNHEDVPFVGFGSCDLCFGAKVQGEMKHVARGRRYNDPQIRLRRRNCDAVRHEPFEIRELDVNFSIQLGRVGNHQRWRIDFDAGRGILR